MKRHEFLILKCDILLLLPRQDKDRYKEKSPTKASNLNIVYGYLQDLSFSNLKLGTLLVFIVECK